MRTIVYPAVLDNTENGEKGYYTVEFPDVLGALSEGHGLAEALCNAEDWHCMMYQIMNYPNLLQLMR